MTTRTTKVTTVPPRLSQQQKALLLWMLQRDDLKDFLIDDEQGRHKPYEPTPIPWSSKDFLGDDPTNNQSSTLSRALSILDKHGLVNLQRSKGKKARTSHLLFTRTGRIFAEALSKGYAVEPGEKENRTVTFTPEDTARWSMLDVSILLLKREIRRIDAVLAEKTEDYTLFDVPRIPSGGIAKTREQVEKSRAAIGEALKVAENERYSGARKFKEVFQKLADMGLIIGANPAS